MRSGSVVALVLLACGACSGTVAPGGNEDAPVRADLSGDDASAARVPRPEQGSDGSAGRDAPWSFDDGVAPPDAEADAPPSQDAAIPIDDPAPCDDPRGRRFGMNIDPANPAGNPSAEELRAAGVRWVRMEWKADPGEALYDGVIAELRRQGIRVMLLVDYASVPKAPGSAGGDDAWAAYRQAFAAGAAALAARYGDGVDAWQIWNEPDLLRDGEDYDPGVPPHHFGPMLVEAVAAIRPYSSRPIISAGLASGDPGYLAAALEATGGELPVDAVSVHPYGQRAPNDWPDPSWGFGNMSDLFRAYLAFGRPLWVSEIGTLDEGVQAEYLGNVYALAESELPEEVQVVFWFCWSDAMVPPFGVHDAAGEPKPARASYADAAPPWDPACPSR